MPAVVGKNAVLVPCMTCLAAQQYLRGLVNSIQRKLSTNPDDTALVIEHVLLPNIFMSTKNTVALLFCDILNPPPFCIVDTPCRVCNRL